MTWTEIDLDKREWLIPGERTKNGHPNCVALSDQAIDIIKALPRIRGKKGFLFTMDGDKPVSGFSRAKGAMDQLMPEHTPGWTFHDLRRTAASGMAKLGVAIHVTEAVLNHKSGKISGIAAVYNRYDYADEKRNALEAWARFVLSLQRPAETSCR